MTESNLTLEELKQRFQDKANSNSALDLQRAARGMNDAQNLVIARGSLIIGGSLLPTGRLLFMRTTANVTISSATNLGTLPTDFDEALLVEDSDNSYKELTYQEWDTFDRNMVSTSDPSYYSFPSGTTIQIDGSFTANRTIKITYYALSTAMETDAATSVLPNQYRVRILVNYALEQFFRGKDDTRANDYRNLWMMGTMDMYNANTRSKPGEDIGMLINGERPEYTAWS